MQHHTGTGMAALQMVSETTDWQVWAWLREQRQYLDLYEYHVLDFLCQHAFTTDQNPEGLPVGRVLYGYSPIRSIVAWTKLSKAKVITVLWDLQATHGYIRRWPRGKSGSHAPHSVQVYWSPEDDARRTASRRFEQPLPVEFLMSPQDVEFVRSHPESEQQRVLHELLAELVNGGPRRRPVGSTPWTGGVYRMDPYKRRRS